MSTTTVKRLAADILGVGLNKVRLNKGNLAKVEEALTRADVRALIDDGTVYAIPKKAGHRPNKKPKQGRGRRKGQKKARTGGKAAWMVRIRSQRAFLEQLLEGGELPAEYKRAVYMKIKGGAFRDKAAMRAYLMENRMLKANR